MPRVYAEDTTVPISKSRSEIEAVRAELAQRGMVPSGRDLVIVSCAGFRH